MKKLKTLFTIFSCIIAAITWLILTIIVVVFLGSENKTIRWIKARVQDLENHVDQLEIEETT